MASTNYPNGVSSYGTPVLGSGITTSGNVFFVDSGVGVDGVSSGTISNPFASIDYAVGRCTASNGDVIMVRPGHTETVTAAGGITVDVVGVSIIGMGHGSDRPTVNFTTATTATLLVSAANCVIKNLLLTGGVDELVAPLSIQAADCQLIDLETKDVTGQAVDYVASTAAADRLHINGWVHRGASAAGASGALTVAGTPDGILVENFLIDGNFSQAAIRNGGAATNITINNGYIRNRDTSDPEGIRLLATTTGNVGPNINIRLDEDAANVTAAVSGADAQFFQPINIVNADGESSMQTNITATVDEA